MARIKICGITNEADAKLAVEAGADAIGLNFYPRSPRYVEPAVAERIVQLLPPFVEPVALFVNEPLGNAIATTRRVGAVRTIQWHGDDPEPCSEATIRFVPAFQVGDAAGLERVRRYLDLCRGLNCLPAAILVDGHVAGQYGGTGRLIPWQMLDGFRLEVPLILAGGLTPDNVAEAVRTVRPYAVDVASGVEKSPGIKDPELMRRFITNARSVAGNSSLCGV